jgi:hypothetical protein
MAKPVKKNPAKEREDRMIEEYRVEIKGLSAADLTSRLHFLSSQVNGCIVDQVEFHKQIAALNAKVRDSRRLQSELEAKMVCTYGILRDHR